MTPTMRSRRPRAARGADARDRRASHQARLKSLARSEIPEGERAGEWIERVRDAGYKAAIERVFVIREDAFDWNGPQHITPRLTTEEIHYALTQHPLWTRE
jgi:hypothetical protein